MSDKPNIRLKIVKKAPKAFITRIRIQNYKSIGQCNVALHPFTLLVGLNGSGKSNFLDAIRFIADSLRTTLEHALRDRGGISEVRRRSGGHPTHFGISVNLQLPSGANAFYGFRIGALPNGGFTVQQEKCHVVPAVFGESEHSYLVENGTLTASSTSEIPRQIERDRLMLVMASSLPGFRELYDALSRMGFYNLSPDKIRDLQDIDSGELLYRDGRNLASVIRRLKKAKAVDRITEYLRAVVPGIKDVDSRLMGTKEALEFRQQIGSTKSPWRFPASNISDGTLRVLGVLAAAFQNTTEAVPRIPLIGIEEPEAAIHPGAAIKVADALLEAQRRTQLVVTTHSPDLLSHKDLLPESILAFSNVGGETIIAPVDSGSVTAIKKRLYTVGELLRLGQIEPNKAIYNASVAQLDLFSE